MTKGRCIGIDLGISKFCISVYQDNNGPIIIPNEQEKRTTPTYVAFNNKEIIVGDEVKDRLSIKPENTVSNIKRIIGRRFQEIQESDMKYWPFEIIENNNKPLIQVEYQNEEKNFTVEQIASLILLKAKKIAEDYLGEKVTDAVISVPANFNDSQRQATMDAGKIAGLNVSLINESAAAAYAYCCNNKIEKEQNVLIFDLGGGKLDISIVYVKGNTMRIIATVGDSHLGGEDFDSRLIEHFITKFNNENNKNMSSSDKKSIRRLRKACEKAKRDLSSNTKAIIEIDSLYDDIDFYDEITRDKFEELIEDYCKRIKKLLKKVLKDAHFKKSDIDEILLVGGSTRIPKIQTILKDYFGVEKLNQTVNAEEAIAYGAAYQSYIINKEETTNEDNDETTNEDNDKNKENVNEIEMLKLQIKELKNQIKIEYKSEIKELLENQKQNHESEIKELLENQRQNNESEIKELFENQQKNHESEIKELFENQQKNNEAKIKELFENQQKNNEDKIKELLENQQQKHKSEIKELLENQQQKHKSEIKELLKNQQQNNEARIKELFEKQQQIIKELLEKQQQNNEKKESFIKKMKNKCSLKRCFKK